MVSVIIPTLNESSRISAALGDLRRVRGDFEVLVADGSSTDGTAEIVEATRLSYGRSLRLLQSPPNRALQLNHAASQAWGDTLLFLHADAILAPEAVEALEAAMAADGRLAGGNFAVRFEGCSFWSRFFTWVERWRRRCGIYYGDSGLFVRRGVFERLNGFRPIPIMDDYDFVRRLERFGPTTCLAPLILVSDRRWRIAGVWSTMWTWFWVQLCYSLGVPATSLACWYKPVRDVELGGRVLNCTSSGASAETHPCRRGR